IPKANLAISKGRQNDARVAKLPEITPPVHPLDRRSKRLRSDRSDFLPVSSDRRAMMRGPQPARDSQVSMPSRRGETRAGPAKDREESSQTSIQPVAGAEISQPGIPSQTQLSQQSGGRKNARSAPVSLVLIVHPIALVEVFQVNPAAIGIPKISRRIRQL